MKYLNSLMLTSAMLAFAVNALAQSPKDNPKCEPNPVFNRFAGEMMGNCDRARFKDLNLWRWKKANDSKSGSESFKVEGEYWYYLNRIEKDTKGLQPGILEVVRNFENAVLQAKGEVLSANSKLVYYRLRKGVTFRHKRASDFRHKEASRRVSNEHHSGLDFALIDILLRSPILDFCWHLAWRPVRLPVQNQAIGVVTQTIERSRCQ